MSASSSIRAMRLTAPPSFEDAVDSPRPRVVEALNSAPSPEPPRDVVLGDFLARVREDLVGAVVLHEAVEHEEGGVLGDPRRLLHVVRDDRDRVVPLQVVNELLDLLSRDRIERRGWLVHEEDFRLDGERARDAEALLLSAREPERGRV